MNENSFIENQYVIFKLGVEVFGLEINKVKEIIVYQDTTQLPGSIHQIEGIINLRGHVIPIYNLRKKFDFPEVEKSRRTRIVVVEVHGSTIGIIVDGVSEVLMIPGSVMEQPSSVVSSDVDVNFISGIAKMEESLIIILDLEKVISPNVAAAV